MLTDKEDLTGVQKANSSVSTCIINLYQHVSICIILYQLNFINNFFESTTSLYQQRLCINNLYQQLLCINNFFVSTTSLYQQLLCINNFFVSTTSLYQKLVSTTSLYQKLVSTCINNFFVSTTSLLERVYSKRVVIIIKIVV